MEHAASLQGLGEAFITKWTPQHIAALSQQDAQALAQIVDTFGQRSAAAQGLRSPITDFFKLAGSSEQALYLAARRSSLHTVVVYGGLKVGHKRLWVWPPGERAQREVLAPCVLDFYVHESVQRMGVGRQLLEAFLAEEGTTADRLAYDLPSPKCQAFLRRHFGLEQAVGLSNNYVVFPGFFQALQQRAPPQQAPTWASVSARPLTSHAARGRPSPSIRSPGLTATPAIQQQQGWAPGLPAPARPRAEPSCPPSWMGSFAAGQPRGRGWGVSSTRAVVPGGAQPAINTSKAPWRQDSSLAPHSNYGAPQLPARSGWAAQQRPPWQQEPTPCERGGSPYQDRQGSLPPLPGQGGSAQSVPSSSSQPGWRLQVSISPIGRAQRAGAGAGACLHW